MGAVFISYRRGDADGQARALVTRLARQRGKKSVFIDVDDMAPGVDFRDVLKERLASCDMMLALIGKGWLHATDADGHRRLEDANDFVRQEIATALKRNIAVTPVLLEGAGMPAVEYLPGDLKTLVHRNSFELTHARWDADVTEMLKRLGLIRSRKWYWVGGIAAVAALTLLTLSFWSSWQPALAVRLMGALEPGINRDAKNLYAASTLVSSPEACSAMCAEEPKCEAFTFTREGTDRAGAGNCWLKSRPGVPTAMAGYVSGTKLPPRGPFDSFYDLLKSRGKPESTR
jgi:hypothetical protein